MKTISVVSNINMKQLIQISRHDQNGIQTKNAYKVLLCAVATPSDSLFFENVYIQPMIRYLLLQKTVQMEWDWIENYFLY